MSNQKKSSSSLSLESELASFIQAIDSLADALPLTTQSIDDANKLAIEKLGKILVTLLKIIPQENIQIILPEEIPDEIKSRSNKEEIQLADNKTFKIKFDSRNEHTVQLVKSLAYNDKLKLANKLVLRAFLISLVSQYDAFLGGIIRSLFLIQPDSLNVSEKNISFSQLQEFSSIEEAREYIIEKEVENVLRKSHSEQFDWLENKFGLNLRKGLSVWPAFVEITERRNLFVHNSGVVSNQYIANCSKHQVSITKDIAIGIELDISADYFNKAYESIFEIAVKLAHVLWRKLLPEDRQQADSNLIAITYHLLVEEKYGLLQTLLDFAIETIKKFSNENSKRIFIINRALAYKWAGEDEKARKIILNEDWTAVNDKFKLAEAVILDEFDRANELVRRIGMNNDFGKIEYKEWPLFKEYRKTVGFLETYMDVFKEQFQAEETQVIKLSEEELEKVYPTLSIDAIAQQTLSQNDEIM